MKIRKKIAICSWGYTCIHVYYRYLDQKHFFGRETAFYISKKTHNEVPKNDNSSQTPLCNVEHVLL